MQRDERRDLARAEDNVLAQRAKDGDREALEVLLGRHSERILRVTRRILKDREDAAEAGQEAMLAITQRIASFSGTSDFGAWAYQIAVNAAIDGYRRRARRAEPRSRVGVDRAAQGRTSLFAQAHLDVVDALKRIPEEYRHAVALRELGDLEYSEIANLLGVPVGTVRSRIARGREMLLKLGN